MAFLSHLSPNKIKIAPTTRRRTSSGTHCTSATPNTPTNAARISSAAPVPTSALRQLMVMPTTSTIVNASTHSTNDAANAEVKTIHSIEPLLRSCALGAAIDDHRTCAKRSSRLQQHGTFLLLSVVFSPGRAKKLPTSSENQCDAYVLSLCDARSLYYGITASLIASLRAMRWSPCSTCAS